MQKCCSIFSLSLYFDFVIIDSKTIIEDQLRAVQETKENVEWLNHNFPPDTRYQSAIVSGGNVLSVEGVRTLFILQQRLQAVNTRQGNNLDPVRRPVVSSYCRTVSQSLTLNQREMSGHWDPVRRPVVFILLYSRTIGFSDGQSMRNVWTLGSNCLFSSDGTGWEEMCKRVAIPTYLEDVTWIAAGMHSIFGGCR